MSRQIKDTTVEVTAQLAEVSQRASAGSLFLFFFPIVFSLVFQKRVFDCSCLFFLLSPITQAVRKKGVEWLLQQTEESMRGYLAANNSSKTDSERDRAKDRAMLEKEEREKKQQSMVLFSVRVCVHVRVSVCVCARVGRVGCE